MDERFSTQEIVWKGFPHVSLTAALIQGPELTNEAGKRSPHVKPPDKTKNQPNIKKRAREHVAEVRISNGPPSTRENLSRDLEVILEGPPNILTTTPKTLLALGHPYRRERQKIEKILPVARVLFSTHKYGPTDRQANSNSQACLARVL